MVSLPAIMITPSMSAASVVLMSSPRAASRARVLIASSSWLRPRLPRSFRKYPVMLLPVMWAVFRSLRVAIISSSRARSADQRCQRFSSSSAIPSRCSITRIASGCATSPIHSTCPRAAARSTSSSARASILGARAVSFGFVNTWAATLRSRVCSGGSTSRMLYSSGAGGRTLRVALRQRGSLENPWWSLAMLSTSSCRLISQLPKMVLRCTGLWLRNRAYAGYGSWMVRSLSGL